MKRIYFLQEDLKLKAVTKRETIVVAVIGIVIYLIGFISGFSSVSQKAIHTVKIETDTVVVNPYNLELNDTNLMNEIKRQRIYFPEIVFRQAILESNHFQSNIAKENNNLFGFKVKGSWKGMEMKHKNRGHLVFKHWTDCVKHYKMHQQKNFKPEYYLSYLNRLGYSETPEYTEILLQFN